MFEVHNHPIVECVITQLNNAIKKRKNGVFKFSFGTDASWCIARMAIPLDVIDYIVKTRLNCEVRDYTYEIENEERILTLYFHD